MSAMYRMGQKPGTKGQQVKRPRIVWKNMPLGGPEGKQTVLMGAAPKDSLITRATSRRHNFQENPKAFPTKSDFGF